jgi:hypothetical protein
MTWMEGLPAMVVGGGQGVLLLSTTIMVALAGESDFFWSGRCDPTQNLGERENSVGD